MESDCKCVEFIVLDADNNMVATAKSNELNIANPVLWDTENPYLYTLIVKTETDEYVEKFGIRKVSFDNNGLYLNDKPVYIKGFNMHEDFMILGKGNNTAVNIRDFELLKWMGTNTISLYF